MKPPCDCAPSPNMVASMLQHEGSNVSPDEGDYPRIDHVPFAAITRSVPRANAAGKVCTARPANPSCAAQENILEVKNSGQSRFRSCDPRCSPICYYRQADSSRARERREQISVASSQLSWL